jgi:hypothetical protein
MSTWDAMQGIGTVVAIIPAGLALWWSHKARVGAETANAIANEANDIAQQAAADARRMREIEEAAEHERLTPGLDFVIGDLLGGGGYGVKLVVDRPVDSVTVSLVREIDAIADDTVMFVIEGLVPASVGTMRSEATVSAMQAGSARQLSLWLSDHTRAGGAVVRFCSEARRGDRLWPHLVNEITLPRQAASPVSLPPTGEPDIATLGF